jgi:MarR family transcriptional regulator for hemolysin
MTRQIKPIGATLAPLRWAIVNPIKARLRQHGIVYPLEQLIILKVIRDHNSSLVQQEIAEMMGKDKSVILRMVDALESEGFIHRVVDTNDRRRNILALTETGNELIERFMEIEEQVSIDLMEGLTEDELNTFYKVIEQIKTNSAKLV